MENRKSPFATLLGYIVAYLVSVKYFFKKEFVTELYQKHFVYSLVLSLVPIALLLIYFDLKNTPVLYQLFIGGFSCFLVNFMRELYKQNEAKKKGQFYFFDWVDIYFGSYGGIVAVPIVKLILFLIGKI